MITCGEFETMNNRKTINDFIRKANDPYFDMKLGGQDNLWAPHIVFE